MHAVHVVAGVGGQPVQMVDIHNPLGMEPVHAAPLFQAGPLQIDPGVGVDHPRPLGKGVDAGDTAVGGVIGHIADAAVLGQGARNGPLDELGVVQAWVVGAHRGVGGVQGTV